MSALSNEVNGDTTTIEHFGREWTVPTRRNLKHIREIERRYNSGVIVSPKLMVLEIFLPADQFDDLVEINPTEEAIEAFADKVVDAMGLGNSGNSKPSSTSS